MHRPPIDDAHIGDAADRTGFAVDDVRIGLRTVHDAVADRFAYHRERRGDPDAVDYLLCEEPGRTWFAFGLGELREEVRGAGYAVDEDLLAAVASVNLAAFRAAHDRTVAFPRALADDLDLPFVFPVLVATPDAARADPLSRLGGYLDAGAPPDAALDAWAVGDADADPETWAERRGVAIETVREHAATYAEGVRFPQEGIAAVPLAEAPEGVYDPATDRLFVPTDEQLRAYRAGEEPLDLPE